MSKRVIQLCAFIGFCVAAYEIDAGIGLTGMATQLDVFDLDDAPRKPVELSETVRAQPNAERLERCYNLLFRQTETQARVLEYQIATVREAGAQRIRYGAIFAALFTVILIAVSRAPAA